jgi:hypothetical protein
MIRLLFGKTYRRLPTAALYNDWHDNQEDWATETRILMDQLSRLTNTANTLYLSAHYPPKELSRHEKKRRQLLRETISALNVQHKQLCLIGKHLVDRSDHDMSGYSVSLIWNRIRFVWEMSVLRVQLCAQPLFWGLPGRNLMIRPLEQTTALISRAAGITA